LKKRLEKAVKRAILSHCKATKPGTAERKKKMSFTTERYHAMKRKSGKFGLLGKYGWYTIQKDDGKWYVKTFATYTEAVKFCSAKEAEEKAARAAKKAEEAELKAKVEKFMADNGITAEMKEEARNSFLVDQGDGTAIIKREFKTATGKRATIAWNNGFTKRSWSCVTLYVDGETIFTSGHIERVVGYIITH
jgi:hypothetical protein